MRDPSKPATSTLSTEQPRRVEAPETWERFELWHPQWGGYCFPCVVEFNEDGNTCFGVYEWHDGEFGTEDLHFHRHYCDAEQVIRFGLQVLMLQHMFCEGDGESVSDSSVDAMRLMLERISCPGCNGIGRTGGSCPNHGPAPGTDAAKGPP